MHLGAEDIDDEFVLIQTKQRRFPSAKTMLIFLSAIDFRVM